MKKAKQKPKAGFIVNLASRVVKASDS